MHTHNTEKNRLINTSSIEPQHTSAWPVNQNKIIIMKYVFCFIHLFCFIHPHSRTPTNHVMKYISKAIQSSTFTFFFECKKNTHETLRLRKKHKYMRLKRRSDCYVTTTNEKQQLTYIVWNNKITWIVEKKRECSHGVQILSFISRDFIKITIILSSCVTHEHLVKAISSKHKLAV